MKTPRIRSSFRGPEARAPMAAALAALVALALSSASLLPLPARAALKTYDVGDYVQDGLILHFDGIRNAGATADHDPDAVQWKSLGQKSGVVANRNSRQGGSNTWDDDATLGTSNWGEWTENAFSCDWRSVWWVSGKGYALDKFTLQLAVDIDRQDKGAGNQGSVYVLGGNGNDSSGKSALNTLGVQVKRDAGGYGKGMVALAGNWGYSANPSISDDPVRYFTQVQDATSMMVFSGTSTNDATTANFGKVTGRTVTTPLSFDYMWLCGNQKSWFTMTGKIHNFRLYGRVLAEEELVHNRMVDDARFFGKPPVTNVVVATSRMGLEGDLPDGAYEVDGSHEFTAPATRVDSRGFTYACAGYTVEAWDESAQCWKAPETSTAASYSYTVGTSPAKVRLTWLWKGAKARYAAADYNLADYVAGGLQLHYDGIRNAGAAADHDDAATTWANVAPAGGHDLAFAKRNANGSWDYGEWTDKGYFFKGHSYFTAAGVPIPARQTVQALIDADAADTIEGNKVAYFYYTPDMTKGASLLLQKTTDESAASIDTWLRFGTTGIGATHSYLSYRYPHRFSYVTATVSDTTATIFDGAANRVPNSNTSGWGGWTTLAAPPKPFVATSFCLGGNDGTAWQKLYGTLKDFRLYDRVLSDEELAQNRAVDEARFFGRLVETNVVVATRFQDVAGAEEVLAEAPGAYAVEGEWTFSATSVKDSSGALSAVGGCHVETWDGAAWTGKEWHDGPEYTWREGDAPVRLTWRGAAEAFVLVVR